MKDVADAAQISRATLYRYFPSTQDLSFGILKYIASEHIIPKYKPERMSNLRELATRNLLSLFSSS